MSKGRFEAFSDGVFAIAITLLVLEIHIPDLHDPTDATIAAFIRSLAEPLLTYAISFATIGIIWINHHRTFLTVKRIDGNQLLLNLLLLLTVCFLPFPTELLGKYGPFPSAIAFWSLSYWVMGNAYGALWFYTLRREGQTPTLRMIAASQIGSLAYLLAAIVAWASPPVAIAINAAVCVWYLLPGRLEISENGK